jgi:hypothetical protein
VTLGGSAWGEGRVTYNPDQMVSDMGGSYFSPSNISYQALMLEFPLVGCFQALLPFFGYKKACFTIGVEDIFRFFF